MESSEFYSQQAENTVDVGEGKAESLLAKSAEGLAQRQDRTTQVGSHSDLVSEDLLLTKQRELHFASQRGDYINAERLEMEVFNLASQLVGGNNSPAVADTSNTYQEESTAEALMAEYGEQHVNETLEWSSTAFSEGVAEAFNEELAGDGADAHVAYSAIETLKKNPGWVSTGEIAQFDLSVANQLAEEYGENGAKIAAVNAALCAGKCTRAQAARVILSDSSLAQTAMQAASSGLITLAL